MNVQRETIGLDPWLPWPLCRLSWWTEPVRAERLAALRIAVGLVLFLDAVVTYLPWSQELFGTGSLGGPTAFPEMFRGSSWHWSLFRAVQSPGAFWWIVLFWAAAAACLAVGVLARLCAGICWAIALSLMTLNIAVCNAGDTVRVTMLFFLALTPCAAAWSPKARTGPCWIHPWALRLLFLQMTIVYFFNGLHKLPGQDWRGGEAIYCVLANLEWSRVPYPWTHLPYGVTRVMTVVVLWWEFLFPLLVLARWTRIPALILG